MFSPTSLKATSFHPASWAGIGAVVPQETEEPARLFGGWVPIPHARRVQIEGRHIGANWATGEAFSRAEIAGGSMSRSIVTGEAGTRATLEGEHIGASHALADPRALSPQFLATRRRNERAAILILTVIRSRQS